MSLMDDIEGADGATNKQLLSLAKRDLDENGDYGMYTRYILMSKSKDPDELGLDLTALRERFFKDKGVKPPPLPPPVE